MSEHLVLREGTGEAYDAYLGPPPILTPGLYIAAHEIPLQPHIVTADTFVLRELGGDVLVQEEDVNVLYMHASIRDGQWRADSSIGGRKIREIVSDLAARDVPIDVIYACASRVVTDGLARRVRATVMYGEHPRVHMHGNNIATGQGVRTIQGRVQVDMAVASRNDVEYRRWLQQRRGRGPSRVRLI